MQGMTDAVEPRERPIGSGHGEAGGAAGAEQSSGASGLAGTTGESLAGLGGRPSALSAALNRVGDRWTLLLVSALLGGPRRFNDLRSDIPGIAPNVLSHRLKHLEHEGVIVAQAYSAKPVRFAYELTASGAELAGALRLLAQWGAGADGEETGVYHAACGSAAQARWFCPTCDVVLSDRELDDLQYV
jgi:DNA-binding HxlR family transcriptional regulator